MQRRADLPHADAVHPALHGKLHPRPPPSRSPSPTGSTKSKSKPRSIVLSALCPAHEYDTQWPGTARHRSYLINGRPFCAGAEVLLPVGPRYIPPLAAARVLDLDYRCLGSVVSPCAVCTMLRAFPCCSRHAMLICFCAFAFAVAVQLAEFYIIYTLDETLC